VGPAGPIRLKHLKFIRNFGSPLSMKNPLIVERMVFYLK